jgi:hypothetical protein
MSFQIFLLLISTKPQNEGVIFSSEMHLGLGLGRDQKLNDGNVVLSTIQFSTLRTPSKGFNSTLSITLMPLVQSPSTPMVYEF